MARTREKQGGGGMRGFLIVAALAVTGFGVWKMGWIGNHAESLPADPATVEADSGSLPTLQINPAPPTQGSPVTIQGNPPIPAPPIVPLDQTLAAEIQAAEQTWATLAATGSDPVISNQAIALARSFTKAYRAMRNKPEHAAERQRLHDAYLAALGARLFLSPQRYPDDGSGLFAEHAIVSGDRLDPLGRSHGMSYQYINILRGRKDAEDGNLRVGERLKLVNAKTVGYELVVDKSDYAMDLYICGIFAKRYPIGIGAIGSETPTGTTFIEVREKHPAWTPPEGGPAVPYGDPRHIIGPVWLRLNSAGIGKDGIGIHGYTGQGPAVGDKLSNGCIRMRNEDAVEVFNIMTPCETTASGFITRAPMAVIIED